MSKDRQLDKFYTNEDIAKQCFSWLKKDLSSLNIKKCVWLEPSAGKLAVFKIIR